MGIDDSSDSPPPAEPVDDGHPSRKQFRWRPFAIFFLIVFCVFILLCSGLHFPILGGATNDLSAKISDDFMTTLPASVVVQRGARQAYRDPAYFYELQMSPADVQKFVDVLRSEANMCGYKMSSPATIPMRGQPAPAWFTPGAVESFEVYANSHLWLIGYSPSTGRMYIEWAAF